MHFSLLEAATAAAAAAAAAVDTDSCASCQNERDDGDDEVLLLQLLDRRACLERYIPSLGLPGRTKYSSSIAFKLSQL